jgi:uncharacterized membrane protein YbhN (UPF0104 family)
MVDWFESLWEQLTSVSVPLLILGLAFQTAQTCLIGLAWRNILRAAYPEGGVRYRQILSFYAGGNGLNAMLPASAGTVAMLGLFRAYIPGATVAGVLAATVVQSIFFAVVSVATYLFLFLSVAGSFDVKFEWFSDHPAAGVIIVVGGIALVAVAVRLLWHKLHNLWAEAKQGGGILTDRRRFLVEVVGVEALSYLARMGVNATFMYAYDIPVSFENVFLIVAASSISSTIAVLPGAVGAQAGLASVVLRGEASSSAINAYAVGQSIITTAWNILFGLVLLSSSIGWKETRGLIHVRKRKTEGSGSPAAADGSSGTPPG